MVPPADEVVELGDRGNRRRRAQLGNLARGPARDAPRGPIVIRSIATGAVATIRALAVHAIFITGWPVCITSSRAGPYKGRGCPRLSDELPPDREQSPHRCCSPLDHAAGDHVGISAHVANIGPGATVNFKVAYRLM